MIKLWILLIYVGGSLATMEFAQEQSCEDAKAEVIEWLGAGKGLCVGSDHELAVAEREALRAQLRRDMPEGLGLNPLNVPSR